MASPLHRLPSGGLCRFCLSQSCLPASLNSQFWRILLFTTLSHRECGYGLPIAENRVWPLRFAATSRVATVLLLAG